MNSYLSESTIKKIQEAYIHEVRNSLIYAQISSYLSVNGYRNLSAYYSKWAEEERGHSMLVKDFMDSLNIMIDGSGIDKLQYQIDFSSLTSFGKTTLEVENQTTAIYDELLQLAMDFDDSALLSVFANKLLSEQLEETAKANDINDMLINIGDNRAFLQLFDNTFNG